MCNKGAKRLSYSHHVTMFPRYIPNGIPIIFQLYISIKMPIIWGPHEQPIPGPARAPSWAERGNPGPGGSRKTLKNDGFTWSYHEKIGILSQSIPMDPMGTIMHISSLRRKLDVLPLVSENGGDRMRWM